MWPVTVNFHCSPPKAIKEQELILYEAVGSFQKTHLLCNEASAKQNIY